MIIRDRFNTSLQLGILISYYPLKRYLPWHVWGVIFWIFPLIGKSCVVGRRIVNLERIIRRSKGNLGNNNSSIFWPVFSCLSFHLPPKGLWNLRWKVSSRVSSYPVVWIQWKVSCFEVGCKWIHFDIRLARQQETVNLIFRKPSKYWRKTQS